MILYSDKFPISLFGHLAILNGKEILSVESFLDAIWNKLCFPEGSHNVDAFLDWMRDLSWLKTSNVTIIIENFPELFSCNTELQNSLLIDFSAVILPFWENDAKTVFSVPCSSENEIGTCVKWNDEKHISVVLMGNAIPAFSVKSTAKIRSELDSIIFHNRKIPHTWSLPFLIKKNGRLCLSFFCVPLNGALLKQGIGLSPMVYVFLDALDGHLVSKHFVDKTEHLSLCPYQKQMLSQSPFHLCDIAREEFKHNGDLPEEQLRNLQQLVVSSTTPEYRPFFQKLLLF